MTRPTSSFSVDVDVTNPGQFFACCGLLELAHRLWPGAEGWFSPDGSAFALASHHVRGALARLVAELSNCEIAGLNQEQRAERDALEEKKRQLRKTGQELSREDEARRKELGALARAGPVRIESPFGILLDWWQTGEDDPAAPKTWAGRQEIHKIARAAQDALRVHAASKLFDYACVLRLPQEYRKGRSDDRKAVEPFYFDARRFAHPLDTGFSLDVQDAETVAYPAVELLCLIALQRFRPSAAQGGKWLFQYETWSTPLPVSVAPAVVCGVVAGDRRYRFRLHFRDDQKRYKAFGLASPVGGDQ